MTEHFYSIWNQLVLASQFEIYGNVTDIFKQIESQILQARENRKITNRQYLALMNAALEWRDILAKQSRTESEEKNGQGASENADSGR